jgi:hypothetical protein
LYRQSSDRRAFALTGNGSFAVVHRPRPGSKPSSQMGAAS